MKAWKMTGCLLLLCVIICGCVILGRNTEAAAAAPEAQQSQEQMGGPGEQGGEQTDAAGENEENTVTVKTYSEGLYFRSNGDGTCALAGMGSCTSACVLIPPKSPAGDTVTEILPYALAGSIVGSVEIPTTVTVVSAASFADCERLSYVRVAAGNPALLESVGALYTADGTTLLYCPAGRSARELVLHESLERIAAGALRICPALGVIRFSGSTAEWHGVIVGDENDALYAAKLVFS